MASSADPWDQVNAVGEFYWNQQTVVTFNDVENALAVSKLWKNHIDASPEYATMKLACWDFERLMEGNWVTKQEFLTLRFNYSWRLFSRSWKMATPMTDMRLSECLCLTCRSSN
ncbi:hypothetical protein M758_UG170400 [Ceratodon purpureus]|nr:hypothetical protein M758_UG170400 [Ceratodon purpureus]